MLELRNRRRSDQRVPEPVSPHIARINQALNRLFCFRNSRNLMNWFGFFDSTSLSVVYLIFITLILLGVVFLFFNFNVYQESDSIFKQFTLFCAGLSFFLLFVPCLIASLTFALTSNHHKLWCFMLLNDEIEENDQHKTRFSNGFASNLTNFRVFVCFFALISVMFRVAVDSRHSSHQITGVFVTGLWCYLCIVFVLGNGLLYMAALSVKIHVSIYRKIVSGPGNSVQSLERHHQRLRELVGKFNRKFSPFLASQFVICCFGAFFTLVIVRLGYLTRPGDFMVGAADSICLLMVELPVFLTVLFALKDLTLQIESITPMVIEKRNFAILLSHPRIAADWTSFAQYMTINNKGVHIFSRKVDSIMVFWFMFQTLGLLVLGIFVVPIF